jgi:hypothetical protein
MAERKLAERGGDHHARCSSSLKPGSRVLVRRIEHRLTEGTKLFFVRSNMSGARGCPLEGLKHSVLSAVPRKRGGTS